MAFIGKSVVGTTLALSLTACATATGVFETDSGDQPPIHAPFEISTYQFEHVLSLPAGFFDAEDGSLGLAAHATIARAILLLEQDARRYAHIEDHADEYGANYASTALAKARSHSVLRALVRAGASRHRVSTKADKETQVSPGNPITDSRESNPRVDITIRVTPEKTISHL